MKLYLIRHGHTSPASSDAERKLSSKGIEQAKNLGAIFKKLEIKPRLLGHSSLDRAIHTASLIFEHLDQEEVSLKEVENLLPSSPISYWKEKLDEFEDDLALVGHMPFMSYFLESLTKNLISFPNCGVAVLERGEDFIWRMKKSPAVSFIK